MKRGVYLFIICLLVFFVLSSSNPCLENALKPQGIPIKVGYPSWLGALLNAEVTKIVLEEKMGYNVNLINIDEPTALESGVPNGEVDIFLEIWGYRNITRRKLLQNDKIIQLGEMGLEGQLGWYIPDYLAEMDSDYENWRILRNKESASIFQPVNVKSVDQLVNQNTSGTEMLDDLDLLLEIYDEQVAHNSSNITAFHDNYQQIKQKMTSFLGKGSAPKGVVISPGPIGDWGSERLIIQKLGLHLNVFEVEEPYEDNLIKEARERYQRREPFLVFLWTPHHIFDQRSGFNVVRVQLADWKDSCYENQDDAACIYSLDIFLKFGNRQFLNRNPRISSFAQKFKYRSNKDQVTMMGDVTYANLSPREAACRWVKLNEEYIDTLFSKDALYPRPKDGDSIMIMTISSLFIILTIFITVVVAQNRNHKVILSSSKNFSYVILMGLYFGFISVFFYIGRPTSYSCFLRPVLVSLSFVLIFSCLIIKTFRIWKIFDNPILSRGLNLSDSRLIPAVAVCFSLEIIIILVWYIIDIPRPTILVDGDDFIEICSSLNKNFERTMTLILIGFNSIFLLLAAFVSFKVRNVESEFNESKYIAISIYNTLFVGMICLPLSFIEGILGYRGKFLVVTISILAVTGFPTIAFFLPKIYHIYDDYVTSKKTNSSNKNNNSIGNKGAVNDKRSSRVQAVPSASASAAHKNVSKEAREPRDSDVDMIDEAHEMIHVDILDDSLARMKTGNYENPF